MDSLKPSIIKFALFGLGLIAMSVQIMFIREALAIFNGNELVIGLFLGTWMALTALGAYLGSFARPGDKAADPLDRRNGLVLILAFAILLALPWAMTWAMVYLRTHLLPAGVLAGLEQTSLILVLSLAPFCLLSGSLFPWLAGKLSSLKDKNLIHRAYSLDSAGSILGGILFSVVFFLMPPASSHKPQNSVVSRQSSVVSHQSSIFSLQSSINRMLFPGQTVLESRQTPFGKVTITRIQEQYNLYENGNPVLLEGDVAQREESVHYGMLLHPHPEKVLMVSGGIGGAIDEVFKYPKASVDYVETNPWLIAIADHYQPFTRRDGLRMVTTDPRRFLSKNHDKYDVVLINAPDPNSAEINRFYTIEFFELVRSRLEPGGIISLSLPAAGNYMNDASRMMHSAIYATLSDGFTHVRIVPGNRDYFIASDSDLDHSLWDHYSRDSISNIYVNPGYIDESLLKARSALILKDIIPGSRINTDLHPLAYLQIYRQWLNQFRIDYRIIPAILIIIVLLAFIFMAPVKLGLFVGGFTSAAMEFILIIWFQVLYGVVYQMTGLIFAAFMAGMASGSLFSGRIFLVASKNSLLKMMTSMALVPLPIIIAMLYIPYEAPDGIKIAIIFLFVTLTGSMMGALFGLSGSFGNVSIVSRAGKAFSADLLGSAVGIVLVSVYFVPVIGLPMTCLTLSALNILVVIYFSLHKRLA